MANSSPPINWKTWQRFVAVIHYFLASEFGGKAKLFIGLLVLFLLGINVLNVVNSYVARDFMTAIEGRNTQRFFWMTLAYLFVFAALTIAAVYYRYAEERLALLGREWLTRILVHRYLDSTTYYRLDTSGEIANPDQRIAEDVRSFTVTTLSYILLIINASITLVAFSLVLWSISPWLFAIALIYSSGGTLLSFYLGRPLIGLNYDQFDKEANFRAGLIHVRERAEAIALAHREPRLRARTLHHLEELVTNLRKIIDVNRNLGFVTTGYNWLLQIIPALIVAPMFIRGEVEFGVITQASAAFVQLLSALSLIVTQFQAISSFAAVIKRLLDLWDGIEKAEEVSSPIERCVGCDRIAFEHLTLKSPRDGRTLIDDLHLEIPQGWRVLIRARDETAKVALFRATAGIWDKGEGRIRRLEAEQISFLPERPYAPPGSLRELLVGNGEAAPVDDQRIMSTLESIGLSRVVRRVGGLDAERHWDEILSLGEQQLLSVARLLLMAPRFAFLDRLGTTLDTEQVALVLGLLKAASISYLSLADTDDKLSDYDAVLELLCDGAWALHPLQDGEMLAASNRE